MKKLVDKILIIIICFCMFSLLSSTVQASTLGDILTGGQTFIQDGQSGSISGIENATDDLSEILYNTLLLVGIVVAVIVGLIIGIKFMTSGIAEKAKLKEALIAYVAGCIVVFGAFTIWKIAVTIFQSMPNM